MSAILGSISGWGGGGLCSLSNSKIYENEPLQRNLVDNEHVLTEALGGFVISTEVPLNHQDINQDILYYFSISDGK